MVSNRNLRPRQHDRQYGNLRTSVVTLCLLSECCTETLINFHCDFYCVFVTLSAVYFGSMYSRCDMST